MKITRFSRCSLRISTVALTLALNSNCAIGANKATTINMVNNNTNLGTAQLVRQFGTSQKDVPIAIANDGRGNTYTLSHSEKVVNNIKSVDSLLTKFNANGQKVWSQDIRTPDIRPTFSAYGYFDDYAVNLGFDTAGNILVGGVSQLTSVGVYGNTKKGEVISETQYNSDGFVLKINHKNGEVIWQNRIDFTTEDIMHDFAVDKKGNSYLVGYTAYSPSIGTGAFVIKYDSLGNRSWIQRVGDSSTTQFKKVATDSQGNVHVVGTGDDLGGLLTKSDVFYAKYDTEGNKLRLQLVAATKMPEKVTGLAVDEAENVYIAGISETANQRDVWLTKLSSDASTKWNLYTTQDRTSQQMDIYQGLVADGQALYVSGTRVSATTSNTILTQALLEKISFDGQRLWTQTFGANDGKTVATGISVVNNSIYVIGWTTGTVGDANVGGQDVWWGRFSNDTSIKLGARY